MEEKIFRDPAVAGILRDGYVEARLHTDGDAHIERIRELQQQLAHSVATPYYVVIDPETGTERARHEGATLNDVTTFSEFLKRGLEPRK
jgi:hypothetical protein